MGKQPEHIAQEGNGEDSLPVASKTRRLYIGIILVISIAVSQAGSVQFAKRTSGGDFNGPFFITWFSSICLVVCYPFYFFCQLLNFRRKETLSEIFQESTKVYGRNGLTPRKLATHIGLFAFLSLGTNYAYIRALGHSSPSDVTALFAANTAFVFLLSCLLLKDEIISLRLLSVIFAVCGIVLIAGAEGFQGPSVLGAVLSIVAAFGAACYTVLFKKMIGNATPDQVSLFLTNVALFVAAILWPFILIFHHLDFEVLEMDKIPWKMLAGTSALGVVFNFLINFGVAYTYPLFIAFGGITAVPLNNIADLVFGEKVFDPAIDTMKIVGTVFIIGAFLLVVLLPAETDKRFRNWIRRLCGCAEYAPGQVEAEAELEGLRESRVEA